LSLEESARTQNIRLARAGFYEVHRGNRRDELVAVNADRRESDLSTVPQESLSLWQNTGIAGAGPGGGPGGEGGDKPFSVWWFVMILALAVAVAESVLGNRHLGSG
jgi:hypothetical protein